MATLPDPKHRLSFPGLDGLYGWVTVDGQPLEVYGVEEQEGKTVAYIEAQEGKQFQVCVHDARKASDFAYSMHLSVDGKTLRRTLVPHDSPLFALAATHKRRQLVWDGVRESETTLRPFLFSQLQTTDDDDVACTDEQIVKGLGSLQLRFLRVTNVRSGSKYRPRVVESARIHEQSKKAALSHQAGFGAAVPTKPTSRVHGDYLDPKDSPFSALEFRYRSRAILQFEDFIPASPSPPAEPSPSPSPPPVAGPSRARQASSSTPAASTSKRRTSVSVDLDDDALAAELASLRRQERIAELEREQRRRSGAGANGSSSQQKVKAEPGKMDERDRKRVKLEDTERVEAEKEERRKKGKKPEVIDLCDSD
ncbi:hypothetical protein JCM10213_002399 [Rhodosporidiobolus nylandii]